MSRRSSNSRIRTGVIALIATTALVAGCSSPTGSTTDESGDGASQSENSSGESDGTDTSEEGGSQSTESAGSDQSDDGSSAPSGGHLVVGLSQAPDTLDPTNAQTFVGRIVFANMCEKLYDVDEKLNIIPQLAAELPTISDDGLTYTIPIRTGLLFNDGTEMDAAAVKATFDRNMNTEGSSRASELSSITKVEVVDPATIRLTLAHPYAPLLSILADRSGMILSPAQVEKMGEDFGQDPVCVGPFSFESRPSSDEINLVKSEYYYDKDKVNLDSVTFKAVTQPNIRAANLRSGDIQVAGRLAPPTVESLKDATDVKLKKVTSLGYQSVFINVSNSNGAATPPFNLKDTPLAQHQKLRKAFALSLDRDAINQVVFGGNYVPDCTPISTVSPYHPDIDCPEVNIDKAKALIAETGVATPIPVTMSIEAANDQASRLGQVIQGMAKKAGFDVTVTPTEFTTELANARAGNFDTMQLGWSGRIDPDQNIQPFWDPKSALNFTGANYDKINELLDEGQTTSDFEKRKEIYKELCLQLMEQNNLIYLYHEKYTLGLGANVSGVQYFGDGLIRLKTASMS